ncbi:MAG: squalene/phytoene synthase family protein [Akkermansiaceae bacterium]|nr:squalene/phytoene synthase family protein [Akkermansiaceae bacterium]
MVSTAAEITRKAKSNLALALRLLPKDRRDDMTVFYAFCRTVDDIADDTSKPAGHRRQELGDWERGLKEGFSEKNVLGREVEEMMARRGIPVGWMEEIIEGCAMDLEVLRFQGWEELSRYNWKVAGVVGLVSARIFGCVHEDSDKYAVALGHALQLTNILRDVGEDLANGGRIYLPINDMIRFQYSERDLVGKVYDGRFLALMSYEAERAEHYFAEAEGQIPEVDRKALLPARMMAEIYRELLRRMRKGKFQVFDQRHSVPGIAKALILLKYLMAR